MSLLGADAFFGLWASPHWGAELAFGLAHGLSTRAAHGEIGSSSAMLGLDLCVALSPRERPVSLLVKSGVQLTQLRVSGEADPGALGRDDSAWGTSVRVALSARVALVEPLWLSLDAGPGVSLRGVQAVDAGATITGTHGIELRSALGVGASL